jgi:hypothetical protein
MACATIRVVTSQSEAATVLPSDATAESPIGEPRWPPVAALIAFMALNIGLRLWLPSERIVGVPWLMPSVELLLLVVLLAAEPGSLVKHRRRLRRVSIALSHCSSPAHYGRRRSSSTT